MALLLGSAWAQQGAFRVGAVLLPQNTWLLNKDDSDAGSELDYKVTWGFAEGLSASYNFTDNLGIGLDVLYSSQGQKYEGGWEAEFFDDTIRIPYTAKTTLNYLKLPLLLRFNSDPNSTVQFSAFLGPQFSFLLGYKDRFEASVPLFGSVVIEASGKELTSNFDREPTKLTAPIYKGFLPGAVLGFGVGIKPTDNLLIGLHIRGDYAFGDAENKDAKVMGEPGEEPEPCWTGRKPKYRDADSPDYKRPATSALTLGLQVGIYYTIGGR